MAQVKYPFNGQLNPNEIFSSIYNMIISQEFLKLALANNYNLVDKFKVDGTLYGDTKLYYDSDVLSSRVWQGDSEASNLLNINRPDAPECQAITLDQFRQIDITVDQYLSKRAWGSESVFSDFTSRILGMIGQTKKIFETTMFNVYVGNTEGEAARKDLSIPISGITETGEAKNRLEAQMIAQYLANLMVDMKDYSRDFNDFGFMKAFNESELIFIVNSAWVNKITYIDLPTIFHKDGINKLTENIIPARYFGRALSTADVAEGKALAGNKVNEGFNVRSKVEKDYTAGGKTVHVFPGDAIAVDTTVGGSSAQFTYAETYLEDANIIAKIVTKDTYKIMSAFEVGTEFFNPRSLTSNHYLTWGYSAPDRLKGQPLVTVKAN